VKKTPHPTAIAKTTRGWEMLPAASASTTIPTPKMIVKIMVITLEKYHFLLVVFSVSAISLVEFAINCAIGALSKMVAFGPVGAIACFSAREAFASVI
jgi:hypothetical protein